MLYMTYPQCELTAKIIKKKNKMSTLVPFVISISIRHDKRVNGF